MIFKSCFFSLAIIGILFPTHGQESFSIDTTLLGGYHITQMDFSSTEGAVITDQNDVFLIRENNETVDLTDAFEAYQGSSFTSVGFINESLFLIGTTGDSLLVYDNGSVRQIGGRSGLDAHHVTSILVNEYGATVGTTTGLYTLELPFTEAGKYFEYSDFRDSVMLMPQNRATFMYSLGGDPYCGNIEGSRVINLAPTATYERGFHTLAEHVDNEKIKTALLLPAFGVWNIIFDYSHMLQGSNLGLRFYSLGWCNPNIETLIDGISINDLQMMALDNTMNIPDFILTGTDEGLYYIPDPKQTDALEILKIDALENTIINKVGFKDVLCDESIWLATESGLVQLKVNGMDLKYTREIQLQEGLWCNGDTIYLSPMRTTNFDFQWIRNGEILSGETAAYHRAGNHGFYQLAISNCHFTDTVDVANFVYDEEVDATVTHSGSLEICDNDYVNLSGPYLQNRDQTFQWYMNGNAIEGETSGSVEITQSGRYQLQAFNCNMVSDWSDTFDFTVYATETPELKETYSHDDYICVGDTIWLKEPTMDVSIKWDSYYSDEYEKFNDLPYFIMQENRPSKVTFTTEMGCSQYLNLPSWYIPSRASFQFYADTIAFCEGTWANPNYSSNASSVYWSDGEEDYRLIYEPGVYYAYSMDNYYSCPSEVDTLVVLEIEVPQFQLPPDTSIYLGDSLVIEGPDGFDNYQWSGGFTTKDFFFQPAIVGNFNVFLRINGTQGCYGEDHMLIEVIPAREPLGNVHNQNIQIYPNPVVNQVSIRGIEIHSVDIYNLTGKRIFSQNGNNETILLDRMSTGTYILLINGIHSFKIQKN